MINLWLQLDTPSGRLEASRNEGRPPVIQDEKTAACADPDGPRLLAARSRERKPRFNAFRTQTRSCGTRERTARGKTTNDPL
jgi:hypothetical protein